MPQKCVKKYKPKIFITINGDLPTSQGIDPNSDYARALATNVTGITVNDVDLTQVHRMPDWCNGVPTLVNGSSVYKGSDAIKMLIGSLKRQENFTNRQKNTQATPQMQLNPYEDVSESQPTVSQQSIAPANAQQAANAPPKAAVPQPSVMDIGPDKREPAGSV